MMKKIVFFASIALLLLMGSCRVVKLPQKDCTGCPVKDQKHKMKQIKKKETQRNKKLLKETKNG